MKRLIIQQSALTVVPGAKFEDVHFTAGCYEFLRDEIPQLPLSAVSGIAGVQNYLMAIKRG